MNILVSVVSTKTREVEKSFTANFYFYFAGPGAGMCEAMNFVSRGITWEGNEGFDTFLRIEAA